MFWDAWFKRRRWERRMDAELRFHLNSLVEEYVSRGATREEAERRARREFGPIELAKDECRDERPAEWLADVARDLRFAVRSLRRSPGFAAAAIVTLALGLGANTAIFGVVHAVLLEPLPYADGDRIYAVEVALPERGGQFSTLPVPVQIYLEWRKANTAFTGMAALRPWECNLNGDGEPERLGGARVSTDFFSLLGAPIQRGRAFLPEEGQLGREKVVVISDALWRRRYAADPAVVGRNITVNGDSHLVVGVASPSLLVPTGMMLHPALAFAPRIDLWKPIAPTPRELEGESWDHGILARLGPNESAETGRQQLHSVLEQYIRAQAPGSSLKTRTELVPIREVYAGKVRLRILLIMAASGVLLVTACVNIANLFLARTASRSAEFAMRVALGASRGRLTSQTLAETVLVALIGGALGALLAGYVAPLLAAHGPEDVRLLAGRQLGFAAFGFGLAATLATGILCGLVPAWQAYRTDPAARLQEGTRAALEGGRAARLRKVLVGVEVALATMLLASAGLLLRSFVEVSRADRGYEVERVLAVDLSLFGRRYASADARTAFYRDVAERTRAIPGVAGAGAISDLPAAGTGGSSQTLFYATDVDFSSTVLHRPLGLIRSVTPGYFAASGTGLRAGRLFTDTEPIPVAIISESLARRLWPGDAPHLVTGRTLRQGDVTARLITVAGVVADVRPGAVDRTASPFFIYRPHSQWASGPMTLVVRTSLDPAELAPQVRAAIRGMDPGLPIPTIRTMREIVSATIAQRRFQAMLTALFAVVTLLLGAVGVYGVVSYSVASRTREIGLRMALGATRRHVMRWVMSTAVRPVGIGLVTGLAGAVGIATALRGLLYGVGPSDPVSIGIVAAVLLSTAWLSCWLPARRAARVDPVTSLRQE